MNPLALLSPAPKTDVRTEALQAELLELVSGIAVREGTHESSLNGLWFHRTSQPEPFTKWNAFGPNFTIVAQGKKTSTYRGVKLAYDPSRYLVVTGEAEFQGMVTEASAQRPFLALCINIPPDVVAKTLLSLSDAIPGPPEPLAEPVPAFVAALDAGIAECVVRILRAMNDPLERAVVVPLATEELVFRLLRTDAAAAIRSAVQGDHDTDKVRSAMRFLRANIEKPIAVEDVARHVAMSPSHFAHRFRAVARVSPMRYLKGLRLAHARRLLVAGGVRVSEAATKSGYESASHFTRDFKAVFGASPADYARRFRDSHDS